MKSLTLIRDGKQFNPFIKVIDTSKKFKIKELISRLNNVESNLMNYKITGNYEYIEDCFDQDEFYFAYAELKKKYSLKSPTKEIIRIFKNK